MKKIVVMAIVFIMVAGAIYISIKPTDKQQPTIEKVEDSNKGYNVQPAQLSDDTKRIINALGQDIRVFDLHGDIEDQNMIEVRGEVFENGQRKDDLLNFRTGSIMNKSGKSQLIFSRNTKQNEEKNTTTSSYLVAFAYDNGSSYMTDDITLSKIFNSEMISPLSSEKKIQFNRPVTLMTIVQHNGDGISLSNYDVDQYDETGEIPESFLMYDRVLLYRMMLVNEPNHLNSEMGRNEVLRDVEVLASNTFVGQTTGKDGNFPLTPLRIEEPEIKRMPEKDIMRVNINAFIGNKEWKSISKHTFTVHYELNAAKQWEARGIDVGNPVIPVIPRED